MPSALWIRPILALLVWLPMLLVCLPRIAQASVTLDAWRADVARVRHLAENDAPRADQEARRLQAGLPADAMPADKVRVLNLLARIGVYTAQTEAAASHAQQALELARQQADRVGQAEAYLTISLNSVNQGKVDALIDAAPRALDVLEGVDRPDLLGEAMLRVAMMYLRLGQLDESVTLCMQALDIAQRSNDPMAQLYAHQGMGISSMQSGRHAEASEHFTQMRSLAKASQVKQLEADATDGLASSIGNLGDWKAAEVLQREAISLYRSAGVPFNIGHGLFSLANDLRHQGLLDDSLQPLDETVAIYEHYPNKIGLWWTLNARSENLQALGRLALAKQDAERAHKLAQQMDLLLYRSESARRMAAVTAALGEYPRAYQFSAEAADLAGQIAREKSSARMLELAQRYQSESRQRKIDDLNLREQQRMLAQRWLWTVIGGGGIALVLTVGTLLRLRRSHRLVEVANAQLRLSQDEIRALNVSLEQRVQARTDALRQQTRYLRTLFDTLPVSIWLKDTESRYLTVNANNTALNSYTPEQMIGKTDEELWPGHVGEAFRAADIEVMRTRQRQTQEVAIPGAEGVIFWREIDKAPVMDEDGTVLGTVGVGRDISERKQHEQMLEERAELERRQSQFFNVAPGFFFTWVREEDGRYSMPFASPGIRDLFGLELGDVTHSIEAIIALIHPEDSEILRYKRDESDRHLSPLQVECRFTHLQQGTRCFELHSLPQRMQDGRTRWDGFMLDISERKRLEEQLAQRERDFRSLAENLPDNVARWDAHGRYVYVNPASERAIGLRSEDVCGKRPSEAFPDGSFSPLETAIDKVIATQQPVSFVRQSVLADNGEIRFYEVNLTPEFDDAGHIVGLLGIGRDMTDIFRMQEAIAAREKDFRSLAENLPVAVIRYDAQCRRRYLNRAAEKMLHANGVDLLGRFPGEGGIPAAPATQAMVEYYREKMVEVLATATEQELTFVLDISGNRKKHYEVRFVPEHGADEKTVGVLAIWFDVTPRKQYELTLLERAELEQRQSQFFNVAPGFFYTTVRHPDGRYEITFASSGIRDLLGLEPEAVMQDSSVLFGTAHPDDFEMAARKSKESERDLTPYHIEYRVNHPIKGVRWMEVHLLTQRLPDGCTRWDGFMHDITERKRMEEQLAQREHEFRSLAESSPDFIVRYDRDCRHLYLNARLLNQLGFDSAQGLIGKRPGEVWPDGRYAELEQAAARAMQSASQVDIEVVEPTESGAFRYHQIFVVPERDATGQVVGSIAFGREITTIRESERRLAHFIDNLPGLAFTFRMSPEGRGHFPYMSPAIEAFYGLRPEDVKDDMAALHALAHPDDRPRIEAALAESAHTGMPLHIESRVCRPGQPERWLDVRSVPEQQADGSILWYGLMLDITERKGMELALHESEALVLARSNLLDAIIESSPDIIVFALDTNYRYLSFNRKHQETMSAIWGREIAVGMSMLDVIGDHPDREKAKRRSDSALAGHSFVREEAYGDEQLSRQYWQNYWSPIRSAGGEVIGLTCFVLNISGRKRMEMALLDSEARYRQNYILLQSMLESSPSVSVYALDREYRFLAFNRKFHDAAKRLWVADIAIGTSMLDAIDTEAYREFFRQGCDQVLAGRSYSLDSEEAVVKNGVTVYEYHENYGSPIRNDDGEIVGLTVFVITVTERKEAERKLKEALEFSEGVINAIPDILFEVDRNGKYLNLWTHTPELLAAQKEALLGNTVHDVLSADSAAVVMESLRVAEEHGVSFGKVIHIDLPQSQSWFELSVSKKPGSSPSDSSFLVLSRDISARKKMEAALKESEARYRYNSNLLNSVLESASSVSVYALDREYRYLSFNRKHSEGVKYLWGGEIAVGMNMLDAITDEAYRASSRQGFDKVLAGENFSVESKTAVVENGSSTYVCHENYGSPIFDDEGEVVGLTVFAINVTERKRLEESLAARERQFRALAENLPDPVFRYDRDCRRLYVNPAAERVTRTPIAQLIGHMPSDSAAVKPDSAARTMVAIREVFATGERRSLFVEYLSGDGSTSEYEGLLVPEFDADGQVASVLSIVHEVTSLRAAERRAASFFANVPGFVFTLRVPPHGAWSFPFASAGIEELYGLKPEEVRDDMMPLHLMIHPQDRPRVEVAQAECLHTLTPFLVEFRVQHSDQPERWIECRSMPERQVDGTLLWHGIMLDITERKQAQQRLELLEFAIDLSSDAIFLIDEELRFNYVNASACRTLGYRREELLTMGPPDIDPDMEWESAQHLMRTTPTGTVVSFETRHRTRDGRTFPVELNGTHFERVGAKFSLSVVRDITERKRMEEMLSDSHRFLYNIIDTIIDPIFVKDRQHRWRHLNQAFCRFLGHSREDLIGKSDFDFFPEHEARVFWAGDEAVFTSGQEFTSEEEFTNSDGETRYIFTRKTLFADGSREPVLVGIISDFTERKRMENELHHSEQQFRTLAENAPDNIVRYDLMGRIVYVNPVLERTLGTQASALIGTSPWDKPGEDGRHAYAQMLDKVLASGVDGEIELKVSDGVGGVGVHHVRMVAERDETGEVRSVLAIGRDITEFKRYEAARDAALAEAVRLAKTRSEFLAQMSHELRTPLNGILGYTQILQGGKTLGEREAAALMVIRQSGEHLLALIEDILDLARIEAGRFQLDLSEIALAPFLCGITDIVSVKAREKGINFTCDFAPDVPAGIHGDEKRLRQVLLNLLSNAVKFTDHGRVVLHVNRTGPSRLAFMVEDTGLGIAATDLESIFQPFEQSGSMQQRFGGSGLGLSISRQLMRLMDGDIWVESRLGVGSRFGFELELPTSTAMSLPLFVPPATRRSEQPDDAPSTEASVKLMAAPPAEELRVLHRLAQLGNMRDIIQFAERLAGIDPQYRPFTVQLRHMAQGYQSKAILAFVKEYLHDADVE